MIKENKILRNSATAVQNALIEKGLPFEVTKLSSSTRTAIEAATTIGCTVDQIIKSLLFRTRTTNQPILILARGSNRVNEKYIEQLIGEKIVKVDADFTREITGFAIGGVPLIGHKNKIHNIFIDEDLLKNGKLWAAAGTPHAVFALHANDLEALTDGKIVTIK